MRTKPLRPVLAAAIVLVALFLLNPSQEDFKAYRAGRAEAEVSSKGSGSLIGALSKGVGALAGGTSSLYSRRDYLLFSTFSLGGKEGELYLGLAKKVFVKLR